MIYANIYAYPSDTPLTEDGFEIQSDSDFDAVELAAKTSAQSGTRCYIRWSRDSDGQRAYWGPSGACLEAYIYSAPGRPAAMEGGKRVQVYLDANSLKIADRLGGGNVSEGIRQALGQADLSDLEQKATELMQQAKNGESPEVGGDGRWLVMGSELIAMQKEHNLDEPEQMQNEEYDPTGFYVHTNDGVVECVDKDDIVKMLSR